MDVAPGRVQHGDVARLQVLDYVGCRFAGLGDRVARVWVAEDGDGEIGELFARVADDLLGLVCGTFRAGRCQSYREMGFCGGKFTLAENGDLESEDVADLDDF